MGSASEQGGARTRVVVGVVVALVAAGIVVGVTTRGGSSGTRAGAAPKPTRAIALDAAALHLAPSARDGATATYDDATRRVVLFGGEGPYGSLSDTWTWDGARWTLAHPGTVPPARSDAFMAYDPITHDVLMTGGHALQPLTDPCTRPADTPAACAPVLERDVALAGDLWGWDGHDWHHLVDDAHQPRPIAMATDERVGRVVLVRRTDGVLDTFTWSGHDWIYRRPSNVPRSAYGIGMAYDAHLGRVVAIQTYQPGTCMPRVGCRAPARTIAATWDGSTWRSATLTGAPVSQSGLLDPSTLVADPSRGGVLALDATGATWVLRDTRWTRLARPPRSPARTDITLTADPAARAVVAFGGDPISHTMPTRFPAKNDSWTWNGARWQRRAAPATPVSPPSPPAPQVCALNGPALVPSVTSTADPMVLTVSDLFQLSPCRLTVSISLELLSGGRPLAITGKPSTVQIDTATAAGDEILSTEWTWRNACAPAGGLVARFIAHGRGALATPFDLPVTAPRCPQADARSSLTPSPIVVRGD